jgi:hypothetical protein
MVSHQPTSRNIPHKWWPQRLTQCPTEEAAHFECCCIQHSVEVIRITDVDLNLQWHCCDVKSRNITDAWFEVLTAVLLGTQIFSDVTLHQWVSGFQHFQGLGSLQNVRHHSPNNTALHHRRSEPSRLLMFERIIIPLPLWCGAEHGCRTFFPTTLHP